MCRRTTSRLLLGIVPVAVTILLIACGSRVASSSGASSLTVATIYFNQETADVTPCVAGATMMFVAGSTETGTPVPVSSGQLILNRPFDVPATGATTVTLDFNGDGSVVQTGVGMYRMTPVITVKSVR
jgi:hypothetical protein